MSTTIRQVAAKARVSPMTVSNVLRGRLGTFSPETRERVLAAAETLGYRANALPAAMRTGTFNLVALVATAQQSYTTWLPTGMLDAINDVLAAADKHLLYCRLTKEQQIPESDPATTPRLLRETQADGVLVNGMHGDRIAALRKIFAHYPIVFLNANLDHDAVHPDDLAAGRDAVAYLRARGRKKLAYFSVFTDGHYSMNDREQGFVQACGRPKALSIHPHQSDLTSFAREEWDARSQILFDQGYDGIMAYCGIEALYLTERAVALGLGPKDLTIITVSERPVRYGDWIIPAFQLPMKQIGRIGTDMLLRKIVNPEHLEPTVTVPMILLDGD